MKQKIDFEKHSLADQRFKAAYKKYKSYQDLQNAKSQPNFQRFKRKEEISLEQLRQHSRVYEKFKKEEEEKMKRRLEESRKSMDPILKKYKEFLVPEFKKKKMNQQMMLKKRNQIGNKVRGEE